MDSLIMSRCELFTDHTPGRQTILNVHVDGLRCLGDIHAGTDRPA